MKIRVILIFTLCSMFIFTGCSFKKADSTNSLKITKEDEKVILEYLDTKTDDIAYPQKGKMYSAFKLFGTDQDKIYIWLIKIEYFKVGDKVTDEGGTAVSTPVVLYVKKDNKGITIKSHDQPEEGVDYTKSIKRLFPPNICKEILDLNNEDRTYLEEITRIRAEEGLKDLK